MTQTIERQEPAPALSTAEVRTRHTRIHAQIISYLARNGASRISEILNEVSACRDTLGVHLKVLEDAQIIQCNLPPGTRARSTPFYSLRPQIPRSGSKRTEYSSR